MIILEIQKLRMNIKLNIQKEYNYLKKGLKIQRNLLNYSLFNKNLQEVVEDFLIFYNELILNLNNL